MRKFYLFQKGQAVPAQLSWSYYVELLKISDMNEIKYYIYICEIHNLSIRELRERIKSKEYERIGYKEELEEPKVNTLIKNPIIIRVRNKTDDNVSEYVLHELILEDIDNFLKELGSNFLYRT